MRFLIIICLGLLTITAFSQVAKPIQFREESFDFGTIAEGGGPVLHEFLFTNYSGRPVRILNVQASCGCTTPGWSKEPIASGKTGFIQARYNPEGRPGYFNKSLTVTTDIDTNPIILQIKGQVNVEVEGHTSVDANFQVSNGNWKLRSGSFNVGLAYRQNESTVREFQIINGGTKPITYTGTSASPPYITVDVLPKTLEPGAKGQVKISYNGKMKGQYGFQSDNIELITDDELNPTKSFSVYATLQDSFKELTPEEIANGPRLMLQAATLDFGRIRPRTTTVLETPFRNGGKKPLEIRSVQGNCSCIVAAATRTVLKPGETAAIRIEFNPVDRKGTVQKAITVYTNDPQNPVQRLTFTAYIED